MKKNRKFHEQLKLLTEEINSSQTPLIITEGKTDIAILQTAWKKTHPDTKINFILRSADNSSDNSNGGGATNLSKTIESIHPHDKRIAIAIYDNDSEGKREFNNLSKNFTSPNGKEFKKHKNNMAYAMLIPATPSTKKYADADNLCLEYYFPEQYLLKRCPNGFGLTFESPKIKISCGQFALPSTDELKLLIEKNCDTYAYRKIKDGKSHFAEKIVPYFATSAFSNFKEIFSAINEIIAYAEKALNKNASIPSSSP